MSYAPHSAERTAVLHARIKVLEKELASLQAASDRRRKSVRAIGHELNNAFHLIMSIAENALDDDAVPAQMRDKWQRTLNPTARGVELVRQLVALDMPGNAPGHPVAPVKSAARVPVSGSLAAGHILLAEDQDSNRDWCRAVLMKAGHRVTVVTNGAEALDAVQREQFDLLLMDISMPIMDGLDAARKIRQLTRRRSRPPIIAISGAPLTDGAELSADAGIDDYISKPFSHAALIAKVDRWLRRDPTTNSGGSPPAARAEEESLSELDALMGNVWVERSLAELVRQIDEFVEIPNADRDVLATCAHAIVSHAGVLGFRELSLACSTLEETAKSGRNFSPGLAVAKAAAARARAKALTALESRNRLNEN